MGNRAASSRKPDSSSAPRSRVFAKYSDSSRSNVTSAARQATGLPPKVLAWLPGGQSITSDFAMIAPSGNPEAIPFAVQMMSGSMPLASTAKIVPVRPMPD